MMQIKFRFYWNWVNEKPLADYLVVKSDGRLPLHGNVCEEQIIAAGIPLPVTPTYQTWLNLTREKKRCPKCWTALRGGITDYKHHMELNPYILGCR